MPHTGAESSPRPEENLPKLPKKKQSIMCFTFKIKENLKLKITLYQHLLCRSEAKTHLGGFTETDERILEVEFNERRALWKTIFMEDGNQEGLKRPFPCLHLVDCFIGE
jgi:hypothetical protein